MGKKAYAETNKSIHIKTLLRKCKDLGPEKGIYCKSDKKPKRRNSKGKYAKVLAKLHKRYQNG